ncbi:MAG: hypothetical protein AAFW81_06815 [Pseudomonadota bacterium]
MRKLLFVCGAVVAAALTYAVIFSGDGSGVQVDVDDEGVRHIVRGDTSEFSLTDGDRELRAEWRGDFKLDKTGDAIASLDDTMTIRLEEGDVEWELSFEEAGKKAKTVLRKDGEKLDDGEETTEKISEITLAFLRASAIKSNQRVERLIEIGGVEAALAEIDALDSEYALRRYAVALAEETALDTAQLTRLITAVSEIDGDHDLSEALQAVVEKQAVAKETGEAIAAAAQQIEGDYERRRLAAALAERVLTPETEHLALALISEIDSDHDMRVASVTFLKHEKLRQETAVQLLGVVAENIDSDHDLRRVLEAAAPRLSEPDMWTAWRGVYDAMEGDHDRRRAIEAAAEETNGSLADELREAARMIEDDYDRERALAAID